MFKDKVLLITGGTGSFGNAMLKGFLDSELKEIRIFSRDEKKQEDMRVEYKNDKLNFVIGDIRDFDSINNAMMGVNFVFHAAALKQVPSCEFYPMQAVQTNILGAENVLESAARNNIERVVVLSTDKAVYPINTMGISKAMMEKMLVSKARDHRVKGINAIYTATRYGNVMCSRGSIIPLFIKQIKEGKPLTITNPMMTRFMMSLDDSVGLVMFAFKNGNPGDIFVQKSPASTIADLAQALKELFNANNQINIIGERHAEKMYETLCSKEEMSKADDLGGFYRVPADFRDLNYTKYVQEDGPKLIDAEYNSDNTDRLTVEELKKLLLTLDYVQGELASHNKI
ncbi:polysaccharide biosynthesis protein [Flavobacterium psychrophilum]|uniref:polysaccharide biosynthesis protein n=1 Tax=Flavobacterium psychrophilum TaxID=96345 RepID=UPI0004F728E3|nr:polysaccharide biosynthesis protein [Flavobacterium psychrophilum]AIN73460.1 UDP-glucose 4-epimerase [Flavobacterium psychrophilum FPG3]EKT2069370.1 polysaccharide biosynthesis protein [Flavobacterium psychrophilum]EKT2071634.1 polysaccharide biosynthesis protein [Flavobacterium psychrophilum]EKT3965362.1 polysaccharide biosynthesis protein [Flavobacterium psychrophilum]EKT4491155.1 polysaccharide biosynthesis protein [Flavobacterium psychrophilum]